MSLINCPECQSKVSEKAQQCPKCGYPIENIEKIKPIYIEQVTPNISKPKGMKFSIVIIGFVLATFLGIYCYNQYTEYQIKKDNPTPESEWKPWTNAQLNEKKESERSYLSDENAIYTAERFVENRLKVPSSADFDPYHKAKVNRKGHVYTVISHVESQNSFAAKIRNKYHVVFEVNRKGGADLISIEIKD